MFPHRSVLFLCCALHLSLPPWLPHHVMLDSVLSFTFLGASSSPFVHIHCVTKFLTMFDPGCCSKEKHKPKMESLMLGQVTKPGLTV